jgi:hypothetical protein
MKMNVVAGLNKVNSFVFIFQLSIRLNKIINKIGQVKITRVRRTKRNEFNKQKRPEGPSIPH